MRLPTVFRYPTSVAKLPTNGENTDPQPFRFLDLPKDIRLMIYDELSRIRATRYVIPFKNADHHITLLIPYVTGIRILATCHFINSEALPIFAPKLEKILQYPLETIVKAEHLTSLFDLKIGFTNCLNILDAILGYPKSETALDAIYEYRNGNKSLAWAKQKLVCKTSMGKLDDKMVKGLMTFVLKGAKMLKISNLLNENDIENE